MAGKCGGQPCEGLGATDSENSHHGMRKVSLSD